MNKLLFVVASLLWAATILAQVETKGFYSISTHENQLVPPPYEGKTPPPFTLGVAYTKALIALGDATNHFYCLNATCLNPLPTITGTVGGFDKGWMFEFTQTATACTNVSTSFLTKVPPGLETALITLRVR